MNDAINTAQTQGGEDAIASNRQMSTRNSTWLLIAGLFWLLAVGLMLILSWFAHTHPRPTPFELMMTRDLQALPFPPVLQAILRWFTTINNPLPDVITVIACVIILAILRKFRVAIFLALSAGIGNAIDALIGDYVGRPRPGGQLVHVDSVLKFNSFPSGHSCHMMVFYGFLLCLSLTRHVRQWKYHRALLPLQIYAVITILIMGFARVWEGEHWVTDVLGGYLDGLIWMLLFLFMYKWVGDRLRERRIKQNDTTPSTVKLAISPQ